MNPILEAISERSTIACIYAPDPPEIPKGKQTYKFEIGQNCFATGKGRLKAGTPIKIADRYKDHGYCYYVGQNGQVHNEQDLIS